MNVRIRWSFYFVEKKRGSNINFMEIILVDENVLFDIMENKSCF